MTDTIAIVVACIIGWGLGLYGCLDDMVKFRAALPKADYLTKGDVAFCIFISICPPVGWALLMKNIIGIVVDWDAPAYKGRK